MVGRVGASQRLEWRAPIPFPAVKLGRFGTTPRTATLAPFVHLAYIDDPVIIRASKDDGWYPSAGLGTLLLFDLLRVDVARGLRNGRWSLSVDVAQDFWRVM